MDSKEEQTLQTLQEWFPKDLANIVREYYIDHSHIALGLYLLYLIDKHPNDVKLWNLWSSCKMKGKVYIDDLNHCLNTYAFYESQLYNIVLDTVQHKRSFKRRVINYCREDRDVFDVIFNINANQSVKLIALFRKAATMIENRLHCIYTELLFDWHVSSCCYKLIVARPCSGMNILTFVNDYLQSTSLYEQGNILKTIAITNNQILQVTHISREHGVNSKERFKGSQDESEPTVTFKFNLH